MLISRTRPERTARAWLSALGIAVLLLAMLPAAAFGQQGADYAIAKGRFFTQTASGGNGYTVVDDGLDSNGNTIQMWSEFQRLGGVTTLGYPASRRFVGPGGFVYQVFQRGALQWRPELKQALLSNIFEWMEQNGKDAYLQSLGVPVPISDDGSGGDFTRAVQIRMDWLTEPAIRQHYLSSPNPATIRTWSRDAAMTLYGLPMSRPERSGPFIVQRFQRIAFQYWVEEVAGMPAKGSVVGILGGDLLKQTNLVPTEATLPEAAGSGGAGVVTGPTPTPVPTVAPAPQFAWNVASQSGVPNCGTTYVRGMIKDAAGNQISGITVKTWNEWGNEHLATSGPGGREAGYWDRLIQSGPKGGRWFAAIVDGNGVISSPVATLDFTDHCEGEGAVQEIELNWVRST